MPGMNPGGNRDEMDFLADMGVLDARYWLRDTESTRGRYEHAGARGKCQMWRSARLDALGSNGALLRHAEAG
jgi:hypothetical protein